MDQLSSNLDIGLNGTPNPTTEEELRNFVLCNFGARSAANRSMGSGAFRAPLKNLVAAFLAVPECAESGAGQGSVPLRVAQRAAALGAAWLGG
jgi:hypothetical protein